MTRFFAILRRFRPRRHARTKTSPPSRIMTAGVDINSTAPIYEPTYFGPRPPRILLLNELRAAIRKANERDRELQTTLTEHARLLDQFEAQCSDEAIMITSIFPGDHLDRETTRHNMCHQEDYARSKVIYKYIAFQDARLDVLQLLMRCVTTGEITVEQLRRYETVGTLPREVTDG